MDVAEFSVKLEQIMITAEKQAPDKLFVASRGRKHYLRLTHVVRAGRIERVDQRWVQVVPDGEDEGASSGAGAGALTVVAQGSEAAWQKELQRLLPPALCAQCSVRVQPAVADTAAELGLHADGTDGQSTASAVVHTFLPPPPLDAGRAHGGADGGGGDGPDAPPVPAQILNCSPLDGCVYAWQWEHASGGGAVMVPAAPAEDQEQFFPFAEALEAQGALSQREEAGRADGAEAAGAAGAAGRGAGAGADGSAALMMAASIGHADMAAWIARQVGPAVSGADQHGYTPLMLAARGGHAGVVSALLAAERRA